MDEETLDRWHDDGGAAPAEMLNKGVLTPNEARALLGRDPLPQPGDPFPSGTYLGYPVYFSNWLDEAAQAPPAPRRLRVLRVSLDALMALLSLDGTKRLKVKGMPADARIVSSRITPELELAEFLLESDTFEAVAGWEEAPVLDLVVSEVPTRGREWL